MKKDKKTILILTPLYVPHIGGVEVAVDELGRRFAADYSVVIITILHEGNLPRKEIRHGMAIYRLGTGLSFNFDKLLFPFLSFSRSLSMRFDVVLAIMASWAGLAGLLIKITRPTKLFILAEHDCNLAWRLRRHFWLSFMVKRIYGGADLVIAVSGYLKEIIKSLIAEQKEVLVIPNGIDKRAFYPVREGRNRFRVIFAGRLIKDKGIDYLLRAVPLVLKNCPQAEFLIVGDGQERRNLETLAGQLGVASRVRFKDAVENSQMPSILNSANIFVSAAVCEEGLPLVFLESMACGLARVGTRVGGVADLIDDGENGLLVERADHTALANALIKLLTDNELREKIIASALTKAWKFDWDEIAAKYLRLIPQ